MNFNLETFNLLVFALFMWLVVAYVIDRGRPRWLLRGPYWGYKAAVFFGTGLYSIGFMISLMLPDPYRFFPGT